MRDLGENADAVADLSGRVLACAVFQLFHDMKGVIDHLVVLPSINIDDASDAAGIMFEWSIHFSLLTASYH